MKTLYFDCGMGAAGDMLTAALMELLPDRQGFLKELDSLGLPGVEFILEPAEKCGIQGSHMRVLVSGEEEHEHHSHEHEHGHAHSHVHRGMAEIEEIIRGLKASEKVKNDAIAVYKLLAEAESYAHGRPVEEVHFHEVGAMDAIADVTAVSMLMERLSPDEVIASPIHVGSGQVRCAHGILPVPAPATAHILMGVPIYGGMIKSELCTPTGAALLKHFVTRFGSMPVMRTEAIGYGMGNKDFPVANCVRAIIGETEAGGGERIYELSALIDDMTAEEIGFAQTMLFEAGAVEVFTLPAGMKKSRPGTLLIALCKEEKRGEVLNAFFKHTSTLGVREQEQTRYVLKRSVETVNTPAGPVRVKNAEGYGVRKRKPEYEDVAEIAKARGISFKEAKELIKT